jgi:DNA mismatch repair ATPase MutS
LFRKVDIDRRADAVEELVSGDAAVAMSEASSTLAKIGDIQTLLARIHSMSGSKFLGDEEESNAQQSSHPQNRQILYETKTYTRRKLGDFSRVLTGLRSAQRVPEIFSNVEVQSPLLKKIVRLNPDGGCFPDISEDLDWFFSNFDFESAAKGEFEPSRGVDEFYDEACEEIDRIHSELEHYKEEMVNNHLHPKHLAQSWQYTNIAPNSKDKFTIELLHAVNVPNDFRIIGKRGTGAKQVRKYRTPVVERLVESLEKAYDVLAERKAMQMQVMFAKFDAKRTVWAAVAQATALLDALGSLAQLGSKPGYCRPKIFDCPPHESPYIRIEQGRHPCVESTPNSGEFIPNDLSLGGSSGASGESSETVLLLSGPNVSFHAFWVPQSYLTLAH